MLLASSLPDVLGSLAQAVDAHAPLLLAISAGALSAMAIFGGAFLLYVSSRPRRRAPAVVLIPPYSVTVARPSLSADETGPASIVTVLGRAQLELRP